jgi:hypothetical protein
MSRIAEVMAHPEKFPEPPATVGPTRDELLAALSLSTRIHHEEPANA